MKKLVLILMLVGTLLIGSETTEAKTTKKSNKARTSTSIQNATSPKGFNLKTLSDAINKRVTDRGYNINMKKDGVEVMKSFGFSLVSTSNTKIKVNLVEGGYEYCDGILYKFKKGNTVVDVYSIYNGLYTMTLEFDSTAACKQFISASQKALGKKLTLSSDQYSYVDKNGMIWYFFQNGKEIKLYIEEFMGY